MKPFIKFMSENGAPAGKYEIHNTSLEEAREIVSKWFGSDVKLHIPNFDSNYKLAQKLANLGHTRRSEMPVILTKQIKKFEMNLKDRNISVVRFTTSAKNLKPIQQQIYLDRSIERAGRMGIDSSREFIINERSIKSSDNYIIDGHHRWLTAMLIDPNIEIHGITVDMPIKDLLPYARSFGDSLGNRRNR